MPAASTVTAQNINSELGRSSTASNNLNETAVRNLACDASGEINYAQCRWGINFRGGSYSPFGRIDQYGTTSSLDLTESNFTAYPGAAASSVSLALTSGGTMTVTCGSGVYNTTWLTSGAAGDYTAQLQKSSGTNPSGSAIDTDLALSTTRSWTWSVSVGFPGPGFATQSFGGNLIIKDGGGTLITRPFTISIDAEVSI